MNEIQNRLLSLRQHDRDLYPNTCLVVKRQQGVGLVLALIVLSVLSLLVAALLTAMMVDIRIGDNYQAETQLLYLTEAGIEHGREALRARATMPPGGTLIPETALADISGREMGRYTVDLVRSNPFSLQSSGKIGNARRKIEVRLQKSGFPAPPDAITLNGPAAPATLDSRLRTPGGLERIVDGIYRNATDVFTPSWDQTIQLGSIGTMTDYRVVVVDGNCEFGNAAGYGILLVRGDLIVYGSFSWNGLVLVIGQGVMRPSGTPAGWISGGLFLSRTRAEARSAENPLGTLLDQLGVATLDVPSQAMSVERSEDEMERANQRFPYVRTSYREY